MHRANREAHALPGFQRFEHFADSINAGPIASTQPKKVARSLKPCISRACTVQIGFTEPTPRERNRAPGWMVSNRGFRFFASFLRAAQSFRAQGGGRAQARQYRVPCAIGRGKAVTGACRGVVAYGASHTIVEGVVFFEKKKTVLSSFRFDPVRLGFAEDSTLCARRPAHHLRLKILMAIDRPAAFRRPSRIVHRHRAIVLGSEGITPHLKVLRSLRFHDSHAPWFFFSMSPELL